MRDPTARFLSRADQTPVSITANVLIRNKASDAYVRVAIPGRDARHHCHVAATLVEVEDNV